MEIDDGEAEVKEPAQSAMRIVRQYVEKNFDNPVLLSYSDALDLERSKKMKQSIITNCARTPTMMAPMKTVVVRWWKSITRKQKWRSQPSPS